MADTIDFVLNSPRRALLFGDSGVSINAPPRKLIAPGSVISVTVTSPTRTPTFGDAGVVKTRSPRTLSSGSTDVTLAAPHHTLVATLQTGAIIDVNVTAPMPSLLGTWGNVIDMNAVAPLRSLNFSVSIGTALSATLSVPARQLATDYVPYFALTKPARTLAASLTVGTTMSLNVSAPRRAVSSDALHSNFIIGTLNCYAKTLSSSVLAGSVMSFSRTTRPRHLDASGTMGTISQIALSHRPRTIASLVLTPNFINAALLIPPQFLTALLIDTLPTQFRTWVLNVRKQALTEYGNFQFNSMTEFRGRFLAAGPNGIVQLAAQDLDDAANIDATVVSATSDFGSSFNKRVPRIYVGYKSTGDMEFHTITSQDGKRKYLLSRNGITDIQQRRVPVGRGPKARYWQFEFINRDGSDFLLESMMVYPEKYNRRII